TIEVAQQDDAPIGSNILLKKLKKEYSFIYSIRCVNAQNTKVVIRQRKITQNKASRLVANHLFHTEQKVSQKQRTPAGRSDGVAYTHLIPRLEQPHHALRLTFTLHLRLLNRPNIEIVIDKEAAQLALPSS
ncbi:unnamed protein product, partial [Ixodes hexagonus]